MRQTGDEKKYKAFPALPPSGLVTGGYKIKVVVAWLSFLGIFIGIAGTGGPFAVLFPVSLVMFLVSLVLLLHGRAKERPLWLYRKAGEDFQRAQYDRALGKLEIIARLRPDMEKELYPAVRACRLKAGINEK